MEIVNLKNWGTHPVVNQEQALDMIKNGSSDELVRLLDGATRQLNILRRVGVIPPEAKKEIPVGLTDRMKKVLDTLQFCAEYKHRIQKALSERVVFKNKNGTYLAIGPAEGQEAYKVRLTSDGADFSCLATRQEVDGILLNIPVFAPAPTRVVSEDPVDWDSVDSLEDEALMS